MKRSCASRDIWAANNKEKPWSIKDEHNVAGTGLAQQSEQWFHNTTKKNGTYWFNVRFNNVNYMHRAIQKCIYSTDKVDLMIFLCICLHKLCCHTCRSDSRANGTVCARAEYQSTEVSAILLTFIVMCGCQFFVNFQNCWVARAHLHLDLHHSWISDYKSGDRIEILMGHCWSNAKYTIVYLYILHKSAFCKMYSGGTQRAIQLPWLASASKEVAHSEKLLVALSALLGPPMRPMLIGNSL